MAPPIRQGTPAPVLLLVALLAAPALSGCLGAPEHDVVATFYPMEFLVRSIAGEAVTVGVLIDGAEPHDWEPSVADVTRLDAARLVVAHHPGFEPWLDGLVDGLGRDAPLVTYTAGALVEGPDGHGHGHQHGDDDEGQDDDHASGAEEEHDGEHENETAPGVAERLERDPHTWLDPVLLAHQANVTAERMGLAFPDHARVFEAGHLALLTRLGTLHAAYEARLAACDTRHIVTQHDAFSHLAHRYDITVHAVTGLSPRAEPSPETIDRIIDLMETHGIETVFVEPLVDPGIMAAIARETGASVATLNPLESRTAAEVAAGADMVDIMYANLDALADAMGCTPP